MAVIAATRSLPQEGQQLRPEQADAIWQGMADVAKALRKAGYAKPKASRKVKPAPTPETPQKAAQGAATGESTPTPADTIAKPARKPRTAKAKTPAAPGNDQPA